METAGIRHPGIELRHFRYFVAVAEELHFGRAAARLNIVQPALTAQIKSLENMFGIELLERTKRSVQLTEAGREFLRESYAALVQVGSAIDTVRDFARGKTGTLRLGYGANAAIAGLISSSIRRFTSEWPNVKVTLKEMPSSEVSDALLHDDIDVGYAATTGKEPKGVTSSKVGSWPWLLALPDNHRLAEAGHAKVADVSGENLAVYAEPDGRSNIAGVMTSFPDLAPQHVYRTSHIMSLMTYVSSGLGVAFVPSPMQSLNFRGVVYLEVTDPLPQMEMRLLWRSESARATVENYIASVQL
ncbi:LysR family transcriptional regulator [Aliirhizobium cellulosilyticum]|uniref:DNA-binding transcriptional LysR family regulator n=1 Tax=Aliirhizobium cellulosilyticum TaxID=393664 RepID=A0A7W6TJ36_9HYPH|nr:LysR substrate-binding domain-containing protein [Rhizobium cellulosilyticum]MBB4351065.1 DNA-binding transcriptional LysR family regulator [Rhizobium cellulosilyticum]MBB4414359.1 DNA-binding transcriptional LysR family regulator [Rhizobium cellulosilyticum]MBB4448975.1 DNA-binding transcriptional LysR family regulator [Rhizobium cellulosilyticum]